MASFKAGDRSTTAGIVTEPLDHGDETTLRLGERALCELCADLRSQILSSERPRRPRASVRLCVL